MHAMSLATPIVPLVDDEDEGVSGSSEPSGQSEAVSAQSEAISAQSEAISAQSEAISEQSEAISEQSESVSATSEQSESVSAQSEAISATSGPSEAVSATSGPSEPNATSGQSEAIGSSEPNATSGQSEAISATTNATSGPSEAISATTGPSEAISAKTGQSEAISATTEQSEKEKEEEGKGEGSRAFDNISGALSTVQSTLAGALSDAVVAATTTAAAATTAVTTAATKAMTAEPDTTTAATTAATTAQTTAVTLEVEKNILAGELEFEMNDREMIEKGIQQFNDTLRSTPMEAHIRDIDAAFSSDIPFIKWTPTSSLDEIKGPVTVSYCNLSLGGLSDFVPHHNVFIFTEVAQPDLIAMMDAVHSVMMKKAGIKDGYELKGSITAGPRVSLRLHIGAVFHVPIITVHFLDRVVALPQLPSAMTQIESEPFMYNAKPIGPYNRLDLMMELMLHSDAEPYAQVNALVARGMNELCIKPTAQQDESESPNAIIQRVCDGFAELLIPESIQTTVKKQALVAIMQNPAVQTADQMRFSDIFPSGQYGEYFNQVAHRCDSADATGALEVILADRTRFPVKRTDVIVAALTAVNQAMRASGGHIVASGGAAVSYYIQGFLQDADAQRFTQEVVAESGANMEQLKERCGKIRMNDIDCFVFGDVSRQFLLLFSLYMMILYDNFFGRPMRYNKREALVSQVKKIRFLLSPTFPDDHIDLFMYGNRKKDANTQLISKRLQKNPKVQLVTQETKCFSQIAHPVCAGACKEDSYHMQPLDLVKKELQEFANLYRISLYQPDAIDPPADLDVMVARQYTSDNMVSMKTTMLDLVCILCDEGKSLFIRIFMARKNPKDFVRLRAFLDVYLLQLLRYNPEGFDKTGFIDAVGKLRETMDALNAKYYLEQGSIAAINVETAAQIGADRADFLKQLRSIGRQIVAVPDPFEDRVPVQFQTKTGDELIKFFRKSRTMKCRFNMDAHMRGLVGLRKDRYDTWLDKVFEHIHFTRDTEDFFRSKMMQIMGAEPDRNQTIGFAHMPVRSHTMLRLHDALKGVHPQSGDAFLKLSGETYLSDVLLPPIVLHIANAGGLVPTAHYVGVEDTIYDADTKRRLFPTLVKYMLLPKEMERNPELDEQNVYDQYDDAVKEEIGRILLEYYAIAIATGRNMQGGGKSHTRKRRQRCRWLHATTKRSRHCTTCCRDKTRRDKARCDKNKGKRKHARTMRQGTMRQGTMR